ncbi:putative alpha-1,2-mannosidase, partial [Dysgonomonas sp. PFB1-18]|nr:putative alpha-1,2-mannosidase [Dysgonomonas sp. PF1-14]MDH6338636.1 putative alpha-1,2-mannosidase [Dysgonomonas sp. PF1-16]MDH6379916.1 putative alpha-1,2-mannosidase [Dysgonomonas sp. PFB1-18]MDH6397464.1 putative alpha-1,2-mannosidase [Dysgonomonas sp. PF1-23]
MKRRLLLSLLSFLSLTIHSQNFSDYVTPLVGTQSKHSLSTGNTYPAIARPWGMN